MAFLNVLWSTLFFAVKRPDWALIEVALLWLSVLLPMLRVLALCQDREPLSDALFAVGVVRGVPQPDGRPSECAVRLKRGLPASRPSVSDSSAMAELFASGRLVDLILVVVVLEARLFLIGWRSRAGHAARSTFCPI